MYTYRLLQDGGCEVLQTYIDPETEETKENILTQIRYLTGEWIPNILDEATSNLIGRISVAKLNQGCFDYCVSSEEVELLGTNASDGLIQEYAQEQAIQQQKINLIHNMTQDDVISIQNAIPILKTATKMIITPRIRADELTKDEMLQIIELYPKYEIGISYQAGDIFTYNDNLYEVVQAHTSQQDWSPDTTLSLYKNHTQSTVIANWTQPLGSFDAYQIGDKVMYNGQIWICISGDSEGNNVWKPDVFGWEVYEEIPPDVIPDWVQPLGSFDAYQIDDIVTHNEQLWICIVPNNTWEPGVYGWEVYNE